jgi:hypothetical protein
MNDLSARAIKNSHIGVNFRYRFWPHLTQSLFRMPAQALLHDESEYGENCSTHQDLIDSKRRGNRPAKTIPCLCKVQVRQHFYQDQVLWDSENLLEQLPGRLIMVAHVDGISSQGSVRGILIETLVSPISFCEGNLSQTPKYLRGEARWIDQRNLLV